MKTEIHRPTQSREAYGYGLLAYLLLAILATWSLVLHPGVVGHNWDWSIDWNFEGITDLRNNALSAWFDIGPGGPNVAMSNALCYYVLAAFGNPKVLSNAALLLLFPFGALSGMFLVRQTMLRVGINGFFAAWLGGLTFGFSPYFFNEFQGGALSQLLGHIGFAFVLGLLTVYVRTGRKVWIAVAAAASILLDSSVTDFIFSFPLAFVLLCLPLTRASLRTFGAYALGVLGINCYWLLSFLHVFFARTAHEASYDALVSNLSSGAPKAWELFTNSGYFFSFFDHAWEPLVLLAGIGAIAIFYGALFFVADGYLRAISAWLALLFFGIGVASVAHGPFSIVILWAYGHVPFMTFLRTPQHLIIVPALAFSVVTGVGWGVFLNKSRSKYAWTAILVLFLVAHAPYFTGDLSSSFLTSSGPGQGLSLFQPSPGYEQVARSIDTSPTWSRALFVPSTLSPLYVASPFQQAAQGGDPFVLDFVGHGSWLADATGVMNRPARELTRTFNDRLPESLSTGMPALFDATRLILRYDVLVNGGSGDFALDGELPYRARSYLKRHTHVWGKPSSYDFVDVYSAHAPGRVFLSSNLPVLNGGTADVPDLEAIAPIAAFATDTSGLRPPRGLLPSYEFQGQWDDDIDEAASSASHSDIRAANKVGIGESGDYVILLHRRPHEVPDSVTMSADGVQAVNVSSLESRVQEYSANGALWIPAAVLYLKRGNHDIDVSVASSAQAGLALIGDNAAGVQDYFDGLAVLPLRDVPKNPDFSYHDAPIVGIRVPSPGESRKVSLAVNRPGAYRVSALVRILRADREFPVVTIEGTALSTVANAPFISQEGAADQQSIPLPLYWYVTTPLPRIAPAVDVQYFGQPIDFTVTSPQPFRGAFSISLSGLNTVRAATLTTEGAKTTTRLRGSLGPFKTVAAATMLSGRPVNASVPITVAGAPQHVDVMLTPALAIWGIGRGLPLGMNIGAWIRLHGTRETFHSGEIPAGRIAVPPETDITLSHSTPNLPPGDLSQLRLVVSPASAVSAVRAEANVYLHCTDGSRIYQVPVASTADGSRGSFVADLTMLRTLSTSRGCTMYGFAMRMQSILGYASVPMRVEQAEVFARSAWLQATQPLVIERSAEDGELTLRAPLSYRQRIISIALPSGPPPDMEVSVNGHPLGERASLGRWHLSGERLPLHDLLVATPASQIAAMAFDNPGRTSLLIAGRVIPQRQWAPRGGPYWYFENANVYLAWPQRRRFPDRGSLVVIPSSWFHDHGSHQQIEIDAQRSLRKSVNALTIAVTDERYLDAPFSIAAYEAALEPQTTFPLTIDGRRYNLGIRDTGASPIAVSRAVTVPLKGGLHSVRFDPYSNGIRLYFERQPPDMAAQPLTALSVKSSLSSLWRVGVPARKSAVALIFLESFDKGWDLRGISGAKHFVADGYANGWTLPPGGATLVTLYYRGQDWVVYGFAISGIATLFLLLWILHDALYSRPPGRRPK